MGSSPFTMEDAKCGDSSDQKLKEVILEVSHKPRLCTDNIKFECPTRLSNSFDWTSLNLKSENRAKLVPGRIMVVKFFPSAGISIIVVGSMQGNIGFWDCNARKKTYLYHPHPGQVSGISIHPFSLSKVYSSCCDGFIRLMDVEKEVFDSVYSSDCPIFSMSNQRSDANALYFSEGRGLLHLWDKREGKLSNTFKLHEGAINSIDFSSENTNILATSSTYCTACIWDLRNMVVDDPKPLKTVNHNGAVSSAYFSPSGTCLATSNDDHVGLLLGPNFEDTSMIYHYNRTPSMAKYSFRAIWGWDDSYLFTGNKKGGLDIISTSQKRKIVTLRYAIMRSFPFCFDAHPFNTGMIAGAGPSGHVFVWTKR